MNLVIPVLLGIVASVTGYFGYQANNEHLGAFDDPFVSVQLADSPQAGYVLSTDGTNNEWIVNTGGGGGGGGFPVYIQNGGATQNTGTTTLNFTPNSFALVESPADTFTIRVATTTLGLLSSAISDFVSTVRTSISETITGLTYTSGTGVLSIDAGYSIPLTASTTEGSTAFTWGNHASQGYITDGNTNWDNSYGLITATNATASITYATTTNLSIPTSLNLFGGGVLTTNNALCIQLTGSAALCDGDDATGGGGGGSISTSSIPVAGNLAYWTSASSLSDVATGTLTTTATGLELSATRGLVGGSSILSLTSGYFIPTTTRASNWDTAFSWGNHASQGYITDGNTGWDNTYGLITATNATASITHATTTNLYVPTSINLFGGGTKTTANDLCIQLTGSSALCDGSDDGAGGGGEASDWQLGGTGYIVPTTTVGIVVSASSTIGDGTATGGLTISGGATTTSNLNATGLAGLSTSTFSHAVVANRFLTTGTSNRASAGSVAIGTLNWATGTRSGAFGDNHTVQGTNSYAFGYENIIAGTNAYSFAAGYQNTINNGGGGSNSYFGALNVGGNQGAYQFVAGNSNDLTGARDETFAFGFDNTLEGYYSGVFGIQNQVMRDGGGNWPDASLAFGQSNYVNKANSLAFGLGNEVRGTTALTIGSYLKASTTNAHVIGTGINSVNLLTNESAGLYVGYNSTIPTLSVSQATGVGTLGMVGIGSSTPSRLLTVGGDIFTANIQATGTATSTNLAVSTGVNLFGGGYVTTANALCIQLTGSADLCDGSDGGGAGGASDWVKNAALDAIRPTTTVGIVVSASSSITELNTNSLRVTGDTVTDLTGFGMAVGSGALGLLTTGAADGECLVYVASGPTIDWASCGGVGGSKWTDAGDFTYLTATTDDVAFGASSTTSAPFWWDVSATTSYIGNGGAGDSVITFGTTGTEWTLGFDDTDDTFRISSSTSLGVFDFITLMSTSTLTYTATSSTNIIRGAQFILNGLPPFMTTSGPAVESYTNGMIASSFMYHNCDAMMQNITPSAETIGHNCGDATYYEDTTGGTGALTSVAFGAVTLPAISIANANANSGAGLFFSQSNNPMLTLASTTPRFTGLIRANAGASSTIYAGFTSITPSLTSFEVMPTGFVGFIATSTFANWTATIRSSASASTSVDTGVPSTTPLFYDIQTDAGYAYLWYGSDTLKKRMAMGPVSIGAIAKTGLVPGVYIARVAAGSTAAQVYINYMEYWKRKPYMFYNY